MLVSLGFREDESGNLILPLTTGLAELEARKLEFEEGLKLLRFRVSSTPVAVHQDKLAVGTPAPLGQTSLSNKPQELRNTFNTEK